MGINKVIDCINKHNSFVVTSHKNLEGDAVGSEIAFYMLLKKLGKKASVVNQDCAPQEYSFLKGSKFIKRYRRNMKLKFQVLAVLDCSDKFRCGAVFELAASGQQILNIDHHISNSNFGDVNWVLPKASSASEMVYRLYKAMRVSLDSDVARALYAGILTDTGSFRYVNTSALTHRIAAELLEFNLDAFKMYRAIYESLSFFDVSLLLEILLTIERHALGKIIAFDIKQGFLKGRPIRFDLSERVLGFGRLIKNSEICVLFKEQRAGVGPVRVNLRSQGKVDVNRIAKFFGGGGHRTASGCTVSGSLEDVKKKVIKKIRQYL